MSSKTATTLLILILLAALTGDKIPTERPSNIKGARMFQMEAVVLTPQEVADLVRGYEEMATELASIVDRLTGKEIIYNQKLNRDERWIKLIANRVLEGGLRGICDARGSREG
jgi:hypothetical protein